MSHISTGVQGPADSSVRGWMMNVMVFAALPLPQFPSLVMHSAVMVGVVVQELGRSQVGRARDSKTAQKLRTSPNKNSKTAWVSLSMRPGFSHFG